MKKFLAVAIAFAMGACTDVYYEGPASSYSNVGFPAKNADGSALKPDQQIKVTRSCGIPGATHVRNRVEFVKGSIQSDQSCG